MRLSLLSLLFCSVVALKIPGATSLSRRSIITAAPVSFISALAPAHASYMMSQVAENEHSWNATPKVMPHPLFRDVTPATLAE